MAKHLSNAGKKGTIKAVLLLSTLLLATLNPAAAQLVDPTRPPAAAGMPVAAGEPAAPGAPVLQSVFISPSRRTAIVSGQTVKVGDAIGDAIVIRINESNIHLRVGKEIQVLKLYPNVEKKMSAARGAPTVESRRP